MIIKHRDRMKILSHFLFFLKFHRIKSISLSSSLYNILDLDDTVYVSLSTNAGCIILSKVLLKNSEMFSISPKTRAVYKSTLVEGIVNAFELDDYFTEHTSITFDDIEIDSEKNIAKINLNLEYEEESEE